MLKCFNLNSVKARIKQHRVLVAALFPLTLMRRAFCRNRRVTRFYYALLEQVKEGSLVVAMPTYHGDFEFDIRSHILRRVLIDKDYEPEFAELVTQNLDPKKDALDIGANVGLFTVLMSSLVAHSSRVLAVEPTPGAIHYLRRNIARNNCQEKVLVFEGVLANKDMTTTIHTVPGREEYSSIQERTVHDSLHDASCVAVEVKGCTLDSVVEMYSLKPGFVKLDTEGAEFLVLSGAGSTLTRWRPVILAELVDKFLRNFGHSSHDFVALLEQHNYTVVNASVPEVPIKFPFCGEVLALPRD